MFEEGSGTVGNEKAQLSISWAYERVGRVHK